LLLRPTGCRYKNLVADPSHGGLLFVLIKPLINLVEFLVVSLVALINFMVTRVDPWKASQSLNTKFSISNDNWGKERQTFAETQLACTRDVS
jgi:hypothetical protein